VSLLTILDKRKVVDEIISKKVCPEEYI